jgi:hypothetical protein
MDDERWEAGMPVLDRQATPDRTAVPGRPVAAPVSGRAVPAGPFGATPVPESLRGLAPRSVPETRPTPLQKHYVLLSAPALVLGAIAITALEMGAPLNSPVVKVCVVIAAPLLLVTTADATLRIWRSAWAWMPVDRGKGLFRLTWVLAAVIFLLLIVVATVLVLAA